MASYVKDPDALLDYVVDWSGWLAAGETITLSVWIVPEGFTLEDESSSGTATVVWLSGGTVGHAYRVTNRITTSAGRTDDRSITIQVAER